MNEQLWVGLLGGGIVVFIVQEILRWIDSRAIVRAGKDALRAEILVCGKLAHGYLTGGVQAPLYRLPIAYFETGVRQLLRHGKLSQQAAGDLVQFYGEVATLNRGLDEAAEYARLPDTAQTLQRITRRNNLKAERLRGDKGELYRSALAAVQK